MTERNKVALVTGASRGIGLATAVEFARLGFDVAFTARTVVEGDGRDHLSTALPGSLETTTALVSDLGVSAMPLQMDLLERASVERAVTQVLSEFGTIDVVINNAITSVGASDPVLDVSSDTLDDLMRANFVHPMLIIQRALPGMLAAGSGAVVNLTSGVAHMDPIPGLEGAWGIGYAASKAALDRIAGVVHSEFFGRGIRSYNVEPGLVMTEAMRAHGRDQFFAGKMFSAEPKIPATVIGWLATAPEADGHSGLTVHAQQLCTQLGLVPGFAAPDDPVLR